MVEKGETTAVLVGLAVLVASGCYAKEVVAVAEVVRVEM